MEIIIIMVKVEAMAREDTEITVVTKDTVRADMEIITKVVDMVKVDTDKADTARVDTEITIAKTGDTDKVATEVAFSEMAFPWK